MNFWSHGLTKIRLGWGLKNERVGGTDKQQRQAKMPAAGATQALRLCRGTLAPI
jgi:hypothetical protein